MNLFSRKRSSKLINHLNQHFKAGLLTALFFACSEPMDYFGSINQAPQAELKTFAGYSSEIHDSHKLSLGAKYSCIFRYTDDQVLDTCSVYFINGSGEYHISDSIFYYSPDTIGQHILELSFYDPYGSSCSNRINLDVFWNKLPVAQFEYSVSNDILSIDASGSYDQDQEFGGELTEYKYILDGVEITRSVPNFVQNINPEHIHVIKLQVRDNDGQWSALVSDIVPIQ